jgi:uncharacterized protein YgiM (DUF1202 family)
MSKRTGCLAVFLSYVLFSGAWSVAQVPCAIRVDHANARTSATAGSPIVAILKRNDVVQVIGDVAYWYRIRSR